MGGDLVRVGVIEPTADDDIAILLFNCVDHGVVVRPMRLNLDFFVETSSGLVEELVVKVKCSEAGLLSSLDVNQSEKSIIVITDHVGCRREIVEPVPAHQ